MKIYTKLGDEAQTSIIGGKRLLKSHERIEAYGTVDELNANIGFLRDLVENISVKKELKNIQMQLFTVQSILAAENPDEFAFLPELQDKEITNLEESIDKMNAEIPEFSSFVIAGGHISVSHCHIARCVCRRAERRVVALNSLEKVQPNILKYLNRLSDYLFVLSRYISYSLGLEEEIWTNK